VSARRRRHIAAGMALAALLASCGDPAPVDPRSAALAAVKSALTADLAALVTAARAVQAAAPAPDADGWDAARDPAAVAAQRARWREARAAYERIEGALAVLFPSLDYSTDERYDGQLVEIVARRDDDLFDGEGVTGMHAIERILWADAHPPRVVAFERALPGYVPAAFPATAAQAAAYRDGLCARLVRDVEQMQREFAPLALDSAAAFRGVIGSMQEQAEKVESAASAEEESRYAQATLFDLRNNLAGAQAAWGAFRPWVRSRGGRRWPRPSTRASRRWRGATRRSRATPSRRCPRGGTPTRPRTSSCARPSDSCGPSCWPRATPRTTAGSCPR
jgi:iron uptake system component EfeO